MKLPVVALLLPVVLGPLATSLHAQAPMHDSNLPGVKPDALQELSDNRVRQHIIRESQAPYSGRLRLPISEQRRERPLVQGPT